MPSQTAPAPHWWLRQSSAGAAGVTCPTAGDLVLDRIFNFKSPDRIVPDDFGVLLTPQTIEAHLARIRADRALYRQTHPQDIAEIEAMAIEVAQAKHCKISNK